MKVIIVGAGLAGLSTAIALRKRLGPKHSDLEIRIYDKSNASAGWAEGQGAALGLQGNGLKALEVIDKDLRDRVYQVGFPCTHFTHRTDTDYLLGKEYLDVLPVSRPLVIKCLLETLPEGAVTYKTITKVITQQGQKPKVVFEDGSEDIADVVIGADGVRSLVRSALFGDDEKYKPWYQGLSAVGGVLDIQVPQHIIENPTMTFFMGATGVFGYTGLTQQDPRKLLFWSVYQTELPPRDLKHDHASLTAKLKERHGNWTDPIIRQCLEEADIDTIYPIFIMPDLPYWGRDGCLLIGDAAHALPPRTGQGSSQAFEDALTLSLLLENYLDKHAPEEAISRMTQGLYEIRHPRTKRLKDKALMFPEPKMPMSQPMKWVIWTVLFVLTKLAYLTSWVAIVDKWDAEDAVREYLAKEG